MKTKDLKAKYLNVVLPAKLKSELKAYCERHGRHIYAVVKNAIQEYLANVK